MNFRKGLFIIFKNLGRIFAGKGLKKLPFATAIYQSFYRRLRPSGIVEANAEGHTVFINSSDTGLAPPLLMHGTFAPGETTILKKLLKSGMVFVDVGANIGYFSLIAARIVGSEGKVYAFEPEDENFMLLEKNIRKNNYMNITPVKKAASNTSGTATFYLRDDNLCAHSMVPREGNRKIFVETITLNEYFRDKKVDVVKIDVEGAEPAVLKGMSTILKANKNITLVVEFYPKAIERFGYPPVQFLYDLKNADFTLYRIVEMPNQEPIEILEEDFKNLARGEGISKLINILCVKGMQGNSS